MEINIEIFSNNYNKSSRRGFGTIIGLRLINFLNISLLNKNKIRSASDQQSADYLYLNSALLKAALNQLFLKSAKSSQSMALAGPKSVIF